MTLRNLYRIIGVFPFVATNVQTQSIITFVERANVTGEYLRAENGSLYASDLDGWDIVTVGSKSC